VVEKLMRADSFLLLHRQG
jgi:hypothetical protein